MDYDILSDELESDPLGRGYAAMDDQAAADDLNTFYRPAASSVGEFVEYLIENDHRTQQGNDTLRLPLMGRLREVADSAIGGDPFGTGNPANEITLGMHAWAKTFGAMVINPHLGSLSFASDALDQGFRVLGPGYAKVWTNAQIDELKSLSTGQQSRGQELGLGKVRVGDVEVARRPTATRRR